MCCKLLDIEALAKPRLTWCTHCEVGKGCGIYSQRPAECAEFYCAWLVNPKLGDEWKPANSRMVIAFEATARRVVILVDPTRGDAWKKPPYYPQIKYMAAQALRDQGHLVVMQGRDAIVVLPDRDVNLGPIGEGKDIIITETRSPLGVSYEVTTRA